MPVVTCIVNCICMFGIFLLADDSRLARFYEDEDDENDGDTEANINEIIDDDQKIASSVKLEQICKNDEA